VSSAKSLASVPSRSTPIDRAFARDEGPGVFPSAGLQGVLTGGRDAVGQVQRSLRQQPSSEPLSAGSVVRCRGRIRPHRGLVRLRRPESISRFRGSEPGFAFVRKIIRAHGSKVRIERVPDPGTTVMLWLPRQGGT